MTVESIVTQLWYLIMTDTDVQITSQTALGVLQLCLGTPLREGQNLVGACTTEIHTHGSWNEAAAISHSSCTVGFMDT